MKATALILGTTLALGAATGWSDHRDRGHQQRYYDSYRDRYDHVDHRRQHRAKHNWARVVDVDPIYRYRENRYRDDSCGYYDGDYRRSSSYTPVVLGAVLGSALGHRIGDSHGDPKKAAVAGGLLGAVIGNDIAQQNDRRRHLVVDRPCEAGHQRHQRKRTLVGYDVSYRYRGRVHHTRMDHNPGDWVKLNVHVEPISSSHRYGR